MASKEPSTTNPLLITGRAPDTSLSVQLHPLVLLTISDYITRHTLREQRGPIVGAIIGQQTGRHYTLEHAFECKLQEPAPSQQQGQVLIDAEWFQDRLESYREVHKASALDLVAIFTLGSVTGPQEGHVPLVEQVERLIGAEGMMLLLFHPEMMENLSGGKLPVSLYESVLEGEQAQMRFRELGLEVETGEAEMIGVDTVAKAGATATAVAKPEAGLTQTGAAAASSSSSTSAAAEGGQKEKGGKGKGKAREKEEEAAAAAANENALSLEDDEFIASLTAKVNAIKMLNQRINLIRSYLETLPKSYLTDANLTDPPPPETTNHSLLRSINAMLSRIPLLAPPSLAPEPSTAAPSQQPLTSDLTTPTAPAPPTSTASISEHSDVHLTSLLAALSRSVAEAQSMGHKFHIYSRERENKSRNAAFGGLRGGRGGPTFGPMMAEEGLLGGETGGFLK